MKSPNMEHMTANNTPPAPSWGGLFIPSVPSNRGGYAPILPASFPPLVRRPTARRRHFCARVQRGRGEAKTQNLRKGHLQARRAVLMSGGVSIFQCHKTPYRGPHSATQGIKQPRPTPSGESRGIVICYGPAIGRRSALCLRPTRRNGSRGTNTYRSK